MYVILMVVYMAMFALTASLLHQYGNIKVMRWYVIATVFSTWWINFSPIALTPMDVSGVFYRHCVADEYYKLHPISNTSTFEGITPPIAETTTTTTLATTTIPTTNETPIVQDKNIDTITTATNDSNIANKVRDTSTTTITTKDDDDDDDDDDAKKKLKEEVKVNKSRREWIEDTYQKTFQTLNDTYQTLQKKYKYAGGRVVPPDFHSTTCHKPRTYVPDYVLKVVWKIVYWFAQLMTWMVIPLMSNYVDTGAFDFAGKMKTAFKTNAMTTGSMMLIFGSLFIYIAVKNELSFAGLVGIAMASSNTWGLTCVVALLGYGLVDLPRQYLVQARPRLQLDVLYFKAAKLRQEVDEYSDDLEDAIKDLCVVEALVNHQDNLRQYVDVLIEKAGMSLDEIRQLNAPLHLSREEINVSMLVDLHQKLIQGVHTNERSKAQFEMCITQAHGLEDAMEGRLVPNVKPGDNILQRAWAYTVHMWNKHLSIVYAWAVFITTSLISFVILWSECTFFATKPALSIAALTVKYFGLHYDHVWVQFLSFIYMMYMTVCVFHTLFHIRIFNYFYLTANHHSDSASLLFSAMAVSRLTPALVLNFLSITQLDQQGGNVPETTAFTQIMGHMDVVPFIANGFIVFFPLVVILLSLAAIFRLFNRCMHDEDLKAELVADGKAVIRLERRQRDRTDISEDVQRIRSRMRRRPDT
eukprot:Ihof_evm1s218 gene=Ihof_evmTU1s218